MHKVVQQNAASAEESASASEEMNAQAEQMKGYVADLVALVGGNGNGLKQGLSRSPITREPKFALGKTLGMAKKTKDAGGTVPSQRLTKEVRPEQSIPMEEGEFREFSGQAQGHAGQ